jgi:3-oxoacyl-[acyl-carrier protein] reductase
VTDRYTAFVNGGVGKGVAKRLGLPRPQVLRRYDVGQPLLDGPTLVAGVGDSPLLGALTETLRSAGVDLLEGEAVSGSSTRMAAVVVDATAARQITDLEDLRAVLQPVLRRLAPCARVLVVGADPDQQTDPEAAATQRALEGIVRSLGKELRAGATANLLLVADEALSGSAVEVLESPLRFFLSARSAYVDGQPVRVGPAQVHEPADWTQPFAGQVVVVTGAARGIGASIAAVFSRDGAHVVCVDLPAAGEALARTANRVGGTALQLDITAPDAGERLARHIATRHDGRLDVVVHNAGITRDKLLANTDADRWGSVLDVNLAAQLRINEVLLDPDRPGGLADGGRIVSVSSTSGIGGNRGQANYAASKAGVIGLVHALSTRLADRRITVNAVAPGFIETEMTAKIPLGTREVGRRINSLSQGGQPVDVAETIAWLAGPASGGITGQVVRVCGQSQLGA